MVPRKTRATIAALLGGLASLERRLHAHLEDIRGDLHAAGRRTEGTLVERLDRFERVLDTLRVRAGCLEANFTRQIDGVDSRLDALEIAGLPGRVAALERDRKPDA